MIRLKNGWQIDADRYCYTLQQETGVDKNGEPTYRYSSYHNSIENALKYLLKFKQRELTANEELDLVQALKGFQKINDELTQTLNELTKEEK